MTPEEIRLKALTFATSSTLFSTQDEVDVIKRAKAYADFIEGRFVEKAEKLTPAPPTDPIQMARKALYDAGGITHALSLDRGCAEMIATDPADPTLRARADAYNALADLHAKQGLEVAKDRAQSLRRAHRDDFRQQVRAGDLDRY